MFDESNKIQCSYTGNGQTLINTSISWIRRGHFILWPICYLNFENHSVMSVHTILISFSYLTGLSIKMRSHKTAVQCKKHPHCSVFFLPKKAAISTSVGFLAQTLRQHNKIQLPFRKAKQARKINLSIMKAINRILIFYKLRAWLSETGL